MKLHRFYVPADEHKLEHKIWLANEDLLRQWNKVLRFKPGQQVVLFDGADTQRIYKITEISAHEAGLELVTDMAPKRPSKEIYLLWSILKKDKNDWVLQKCTELGVSHFVPILAGRSEKTGFNIERATRIITEAVEQCGRSDLPSVREPILIETAIKDYKNKTKLCICEQGEEAYAINGQSYGILIGPEGGWTDEEKRLFRKENLVHINLHDFTLRAETACVAAVTKLIQ